VIFVVLIAILIPYTVRYFQRDVYPQSYIFVVMVVAAALIFLVRKRFEKCLDLLLVGYLIVVIALYATVFRDLLNGQDARECFYMGYAFAMIHRLLGFGVIKFKYMFLLHVCSLGIKFPLIPIPDLLLNIIVIALDIVTVGLSYKSETVDRTMFDSLYKSRKDILKFKQLLTQYLPNQMAVFTPDYSNANYMNNAFKRTFKCKDTQQMKGAMEKLLIEKETVDKYKNLFGGLGYKVDGKEEAPITLSNFLTRLSTNIDMLRDEGHFSFPVIEEEANINNSLQILVPPQKDNSQSHKEKDTITKDVTDPKPPRKTQQTKIPQNVSKSHIDNPDGKKDPLHLPDANETVKSSEKGSSKSGSSDIVYEDGRRRVFKVKIFPILWDDVEAIAMVLDDITQQRIIMELKMADKNKDMVITMVSHELRTPLNGMLGLIDIAKRNITQPDTLAYLRACRNSGVLLLSLVNSILDLNQINYKKLRLVFTKVKIRDFLDEIQSLFDHSCKLKMLYLKTEIASNVPSFIKTDKNRLSQILINLLGNAFKFTFQGGVTLKVDLVSHQPLKLKFSVIDTGIGITKEDQEKLFKMYGRIEQQDKKINTHGIGLGLTISNTLATLLNPTANKGISVESEVDKGTCFSFAIESQTGDSSKGGEGGSLEDISSVALNEDRDTTIVKRIAVYTINNNENYTKMTSSSGNIESRRGITSIGDIKTGDRRSKDLQETPDSQGSLLPRTSRRGNYGDDSEVALLNQDPSSKKDIFYERIDEEKEEEIELELGLDLELDPDTKRPWCMVVDDNPFNLMVACHIMEERGFRVKTALNGQEAINRAREHQETGEIFTVILMDCQMPVMDGYEATRVLRYMMKAEEIHECPIVALTANNRDDEHDKLCEEVGMNGHVAKPLQVEELETVLKRVQRNKK